MSSSTHRRPLPLRPPPRDVPLGVQARVLFGPKKQVIGWLMMMFTMVFVWVFAADSELVTLVEFRGDTEEVQGLVVELRETGSSENENTVWAVDYQYDVAGKKHYGTSYSTNPQFSEGGPATVEYLANHPERSRIKGMRRRTFGALVAAIVFLFPLVALLLIVGGLADGWRFRRLLRIGRVGYGRLVDKQETGGSINEQPIYKLTFEFMLPPAQEWTGGYRKPWAAWAQAHRFHHSTHLTADLEDEAEEAMVYNPGKPGEASLIDAMPGKVTIAPDGAIRSRSGLLVTLLPLATIFVHGLVALGHLA